MNERLAVGEIHPQEPNNPQFNRGNTFVDGDDGWPWCVERSLTGSLIWINLILEPMKKKFGLLFAQR
tara:strand:+ start:2178 stop:2378 length:201 start_codon:yes stop_codon:yes gene_type:complete